MSKPITAAVLHRDESTLLAEQPPATNLLQALVGAARDSSTNIEKMERIFAMHKEIVALQAKAEFNDALSRAQAQLEPARKTKRNSQTNSDYATLADVMRVVMPAMTAEGLSLKFRSEASPIDGWQRTVGILSRGAHQEEYPLDLPPDKAGAKGNVNKTDIHAAASTYTYAQRILTKMIFGLSEEHEDHDGNPPPPDPGPALSEEHEATLDSLCQEISPTMLSTVLRHYKVSKLSDVPDSEYETIVRRLNNSRRQGNAS